MESVRSSSARTRRWAARNTWSRLNRWRSSRSAFRCFAMSRQVRRKKSVRHKLIPIGMEFADKVVLLVDDSIVRGTTSREIVQMAREAGARKVYFASASPPVRFPNVYGIDMPNQRELVATGRNEAEVAHEIGADLLVYQDLAALKHAVREVSA